MVGGSSWVSNNTSLGIGHNMPLSQSNSVRVFENNPRPLGPWADSPSAVVAPHDMVPPQSSVRPRKAPRRSNTYEVKTQNPPQVFSPEAMTLPFGVKNKQSPPKTLNEEMEGIYKAYMRVENIETGDDMRMRSSRDSNGSTILGVKRRAGKDIASSSEGLQGATSPVDGDENAFFIIAGKKYASSDFDKILDNQIAPPPPSKQQHYTEALRGNISTVTSADGKKKFLISGQSFTASEINRIEGEEKLSEMAVTDPKRVKRILANRATAARVKDKKERHLLELGNKAETLQAENIRLSTQLMNFQTVHLQLENENKELKTRVQLLEQQGKLSNGTYPYRREYDRSNMQPQNGTTGQQLNMEALHELERSLNSSDFEMDHNVDFHFDFNVSDLGI